ncbi:MAG: hypothetical protein R2837_10180 [Aliarcobacter sp.]
MNSGVTGIKQSTFAGTNHKISQYGSNEGTTNIPTFQRVTATNVNVNAGTSTFQDNLTAGTTTITTGTGNFNIPIHH